jgi:hypothetical protein
LRIDDQLTDVENLDFLGVFRAEIFIFIYTTFYFKVEYV